MKLSSKSVTDKRVCVVSPGTRIILSDSATTVSGVSLNCPSITASTVPLMSSDDAPTSNV